jgi:Flp pilus assembly protein TadB
LRPHGETSFRNAKRKAKKTRIHLQPVRCNVSTAMTKTFGLGILAAAVCWLVGRAFAAALRASARRALQVAGGSAEQWRERALGISAAFVAVGALVAGSPGVGLLAGLATPLVLPAWGKWRAEKNVDRLERDAIGFFHALLGLARAGIAVPTALFRLVDVLPGEFARALAPNLRDFETGRSLDVCLEKFRRRRELRLVGGCLAVLQVAHREGLPVTPFLERLLPLLEAERRGRERINAVRRSVVVQAAVAFATPWLIGGLLGARAGTFALVAALVWETIGGWLLWNVSKFS